MLRRQGHEAFVIDITFAGRDATAGVVLAVFGMQAVNPGSELLEHLVKVVQFDQVRGIEQDANAR